MCWSNWNNWYNWYNWSNVYAPSINLGYVAASGPAQDDVPFDLTASASGNNSSGYNGSFYYWDQVNSITVQALSGDSGDTFSIDLAGTGLTRAGTAIYNGSQIIATLSGGTGGAPLLIAMAVGSGTQSSYFSSIVSILDSVRYVNVSSDAPYSRVVQITTDYASRADTISQINVSVQNGASLPTIDLYDPALLSPAATGSDLLVNTTTTNSQYQPATAALEDGGFVITWSSNGQDGSEYGIYAQRFDAAGDPVGSEFQVNATTAGGQSDPVVTALAGGGFVIGWQSNNQDGSGSGVYAQRYDANGAAAGPEFRVNTTTANSQFDLQLASLDDGGFVATWASDGQDGSGYGIYAQRYAANGSASGGEVRVNTTIADSQYEPAIATLADGSYVIVWQSVQDGSGLGIYAQRFTAAGAAAGGEFQVNTETASNQTQPTVVGLSGGGFVVAWTTTDPSGYYDVKAQRFNAAGVAVGGEFRVNSTTAEYQFQPTVAALADGGFVVGWQSTNQDGSGYGVYGQRYGADGTALGGEVRLNGVTASDQLEPALAVVNDQLLAVWHGVSGSDTSGYGVYMRSFDLPSAPTRSGAEDTAVSVPVSLTWIDRDGSESLVVTLTGYPAGASFNMGAAVAGGWAIDVSDPATLASLAMTPPPNWSGSFTLTATAVTTESAGGATAQDVAQIEVIVTPVNDAPVAVSPPLELSGNEGGPLSFDFNPASLFSDADGDPLTITLTRADGGALPAWLSYDPGTGTLTGTAGELDSGSYELKLTASDPSGETGELLVTLTIADTIHDPVRLYDDAGVFVAGFTAIQEAIDAVAGDGWSIKIEAGSYAEQLTISGVTGLTIAAAEGADVTVVAPAVLAVNGTSEHFETAVRAVIAVVDSSNVTLTGLNFDGSFAGDTTAGSNGDELAGIAYLNASGTIDGVTVSRVGNSVGGGLFGLQHGAGILVDGDGDSAVSIVDSTVTEFQKTGLLIVDADVNIADNTITGIGATVLTAQNGLQIGNARGSVSGNIITALGYTGGIYSSSGIIAYEPTGDLAVDGNTLTGSGGGGTFTGIDLSDTGSIAVVVSDNAITSADYGIYAYTYGGGDLGLGTGPVFSGNSFADIGIEGLHVAPEESYGAPFTTTLPFAVTGSAFTDYLAGSLGADDLDGAGGDDVLSGNGGDDILDGGDDIDRALYQTSVAADGIASEGAGGVIVLATSAEGTDTISNIENIQFAGADGVFDTVDDLIFTVDGSNVLVLAADDAGAATEAGGSANAVAAIDAIGNVLANDINLDEDGVDDRKLVGFANWTAAEGPGSAVGDSIGLAIAPGGSAAIAGRYGTLTIAADGSYSYTLDATASDLLAPGDVVSETFGYSVSDGGAATSASLTITITPSNDAPSTVSDSDSAGENAILLVDVLDNDSDADGDAVNIASLGAISVNGNAATVAEAASFSIQGGAIRFDGSTGAFDRLGLGQSALVGVSHLVADTSGATTASTLWLTINGENDAPTDVQLSGASISENSTVNSVIGALSAIDADDGDSFSYDLVSNGGGAFKLSGGNLVVANSALLDYELVQSIGVTLRVTDAAGLSFERAIAIGLTNVVEQQARTLTNAADVFLAVSNDNWVVNGLGGTDTITTLGGGDVVNGGSANDIISTGDGNDTIQFGTGAGYDSVNGGAGFDRIVALAANSAIGLTSITGIELITASGNSNVRVIGTAAAESLDFSNVVLDGIVSIDLGSGNDTLIGSAGSDVILVGRGNDVLSGGNGNDVFRVVVGDGLDSFDGGDGVDVIRAFAANTKIGIASLTSIEVIDSGGFANVTVLGTVGADILDFSGAALTGISAITLVAGNDVFTGSSGADVIVGGAGADTLTGGDSADRFVYNATGDSGATTFDTITDFVSGLDLIDLSLIDANTRVSGNQAFTLIGNSAFSNVAGQLRIDESQPGYTQVFGDVNGDGKADFSIRLTEPTGLQPVDFLL